MPSHSSLLPSLPPSLPHLLIIRLGRGTVAMEKFDEMPELHRLLVCVLEVQIDQGLEFTPPLFSHLERVGGHLCFVLCVMRVCVRKVEGKDRRGRQQASSYRKNISCSRALIYAHASILRITQEVKGEGKHARTADVVEETRVQRKDGLLQHSAKVMAMRAADVHCV